MSEVVSNIGKSPGQMDTASGRRLGHVPTLTSSVVDARGGSCAARSRQPGPLRTRRCERGSCTWAAQMPSENACANTSANRRRAASSATRCPGARRLPVQRAPDHIGHKPAPREVPARSCLACFCLRSGGSLGLPRVPAPVIVHGIRPSGVAGGLAGQERLIRQGFAPPRHVP